MNRNFHHQIFPHLFSKSLRKKAALGGPKTRHGPGSPPSPASTQRRRGSVASRIPVHVLQRRRDRPACPCPRSSRWRPGHVPGWVGTSLTAIEQPEKYYYNTIYNHTDNNVLDAQAAKCTKQKHHNNTYIQRTFVFVNSPSGSNNYSSEKKHQICACVQWN